MTVEREPRPDTVQRIVQNELSLRRVNEAIEAGRRTRDGAVPFVCECGRIGCNELVELALDEYEQVRSDGAHFVVVPGHATAVDVTVAPGSRYDIVRKREPGPAAAAHRSDPRSGAEG